jgi:glyoxylase-like metal-dependent hydrolase (beta-lactamase superfamily II)
MAIRFHRDMTFEYGALAEVSPMVRRVIARNPSAFTFHGTGTYIVGRGKVAVIDPGPDDALHIDALLAGLRNETVSHILVTHTHEDHSPAAAALKRATGAPVLAFGPHPAAPSGVTPEQGGDRDFTPDQRLADGDVVTGDGWTVEALHTPGHISNHLCFALREEKTLFSGDHVMGWSTSVISPPDGNMAAYFASLRKLLPRDEQRFYPTHGPPIPAPIPFVESFIAHREDRERQIAACLTDGPKTIPELVAVMYRDVPKHLHPAAARSVLAHLIHMAETGRVTTDGAPTAGATYRLP